jgi:hypothetical protein
MNGISTWKILTILPLNSYDILIGMDLLETHKVKTYCYNKTFDYIDKGGNPRIIKGILKTISIRQISALHLKNSFRTGF